MRIEIKPPPGATPPLRPGALVTLRVEAADPVPRIDGPVSIAYEGRYADDPSPAFLFPAPAPAPGPQGVSMRTSAHSPFRLPPESRTDPYVDIPAHEGDVVTATLLADNKTYSAALRAPAAPDHPNQAPVVLQLAEGGAAPPPGPPPTPQPAPGLTITPLDGEGDVLTLDPAPGNDNIVVVG